MFISKFTGTRALHVAGLSLAIAVIASNAVAQEIHATTSGNWSSAATWTRITGTGALPGAADHVVITPSVSVVLDTNSGISNLAWLEIEGALSVLDTQTYTLGVSRIDLHTNGTLEIGQAGSPFQNSFTLTLTENFLSNTYNDPKENKSFVVHPASKLDMHGNGMTGTGGALRPTWLKLANNNSLAVNASSMVVDPTPFAAANWQVGESIVIASTDFEMRQAEYLTVGTSSGNTINFAPNLIRPHHGVIESGLVDERAEVGLLSRNIVIEGDALSLTSRRGAQFRVEDQPAATARIEWVEFRYMGWYGAKGRYPVHFHEMGLATGSCLRYSSVHHSFHRAISVHSTIGLTIEGNVACDNYGHTFYFEDGDETANVVLNNLGLLTRRPDVLPPGVARLGAIWSVTNEPFFSIDEENPATFWLLNYDNPIGFNSAAGSDGYGYWVEPTLAKVINPLPITNPIFINNTAHSNGIHGYFQDTARTYPMTILGYPPLTIDVNQRMQIDNFTSYKNRQAGVWNRAYGESIWFNAMVADNEFGFYLASEGIQRDYQEYLDIIKLVFPGTIGANYYNYLLTQVPGGSIALLWDCKILGETNNLGFPVQPYELSWSPQRSLPNPSSPELMIKGVELYDGLIAIVGGTIRNLNDATFSPAVTHAGGTFNYRASAGISIRGRHSWDLPGNFWCVDPRCLIWACSLVNVAHPALFPIPHLPSLFGSPAQMLSPNGVRDLAVFDVDGSLTPGLPNRYYTNNTPLMAPPGAPAATPLPGLTHYAAPLVVGGPGTMENRAYGNLLLTIGPASSTTWNVNPNVSALSYVDLRVATAGRSPGPVPIYFLPISPDPMQIYPSNILLTVPGGTHEEYEYFYPTAAPPADDPRNLELRLRFSEQSRSAIVSVPYDRANGLPPSRVEFYNGMDAENGIPRTVVTSSVIDLNTLKGSNGRAFFYDSTLRRLFLKPTLYDPSHIAWLTAGNHPILSGREVICEVHN